MLFVDTLRLPYYDKLVGNATKNFFDLVISREMIKSAIKFKKLTSRESSSAKMPGLAKKKDEATSCRYVS